MLEIYKKVEKTLDNPYGIKQISNVKELNRPFLFCLTPQDILDKSIFGIIKEGARAARIRTSDDYAAGFKIEEVPIDFIGAKFIREDIKDNKAEILTNDYIYQLFKGKSKEEMLKQARKMNFFLYCDAVRVYAQIEKKLHQKLKNDGLEENDIKEIMSQISVVAIATEIDISKLESTIVLFKDANDGEVFDKISSFSLKKMDELGRNAYISRINNRVLTYVYNGTGEHMLKEYFSEGTPVKSALSAIVSNLLENSIKNEKQEKLIPINKDLLLPILIRNNAELIDGNDLLNRLDESLNYDGATKYTKNEHELLSSLEIAYKKLIKTQNELTNRTKECNDERSKKDLLINGIKEKCSDVAFQQIVAANKLYNAQIIPQLENQKTDRQIREEYELLQNEKTRSL